MADVETRIERQEMIDEMLAPFNLFHEMYKTDPTEWTRQTFYYLEWLEENLREGNYFDSDRNKEKIYPDQVDYYYDCHRAWNEKEKKPTEVAHTTYSTFLDLLKYDVNPNVPEPVTGFNKEEVEKLKQLIAYLSYHFAEAAQMFMTVDEKLDGLKAAGIKGAFESNEEDIIEGDLHKEAIKNHMIIQGYDPEKIAYTIKSLDSVEKARAMHNWLINNPEAEWYKINDETVSYSEGGVSY